ncbi:unnamed protein product [Moneuplotes crassus]|uniref:Uncharacterized protein n=1 Tax=Euplotes crassus TaxID=5936 RepID=A0AAD1U7C6_EUPCR|nr:unnamed protein product [Moneuplotes crassus]
MEIDRLEKYCKKDNERLQADIKALKREVKDKENQRVKEVAILEQKLELQKLQIDELRDQTKMQKNLYDTMMESIKIANNPVNAEQKYLSMIKDLEKKHEKHLLETISQYTQRCESLYAYIKDAEKLLDDMDSKRKQEKKEMLLTHAKEIDKIHEKYKKHISMLKKKLTKKTKEIRSRSNSISQIKYVSESRDAEIEKLKDELTNKEKLLVDNNDQIICLKSKIHGLRTIINELRCVEKKYKLLLTKSQFSTGSFETDQSRETPIYIEDSKRKVKSREKKSSKKTRNNYIKTSRGTNEMKIYDQQFSSKKQFNRDHSKKRKSKRKNSKLKINIKENNAPEGVVPQSAHTQIEVAPLMPNYTFQENLKHQKHNLMERMNRIESIITSGKSYDRGQDENFKPLASNEYNYDYNADYTPVTKRSTISPIPSCRMAGYNSRSHKIPKKSEPRSRALYERNVGHVPEFNNSHEF